MLTAALIQAIPIDPTLTDFSEETDSLIIRYSDNKTFWGARLGFFPAYGKYVESAGISETLFSETKISKVLNLGWSFQLNEVLGGNGGYLALYAYLNHPFKIGDSIIFIKGGLGLGTYGTYPSPAVLLEIEYLIFEFENSAISFSLSETIIGFNIFMPPVISIGILF